MASSFVSGHLNLTRSSVDAHAAPNHSGKSWCIKKRANRGVNTGTNTPKTTQMRLV